MNKYKNNIRMCEQAFTLIEMIGVIAIIAILAAVISPSVIKQLQSARQDAEDKTLSFLADGLIDYVLENRIIPQSGEGSGTWATNIATQMDSPTEKVYENDPGNSRRYWFDPATNLNGLSDNSASYNQNTVSAANISGDATTSTASALTNPRAMIISDLSPGGTNNILVASVAHNSTNFAAAWDQTGTLTESSTLKIKRINFSQMFKTLTLQSSNGNYFARESYSSPSSSSPTVTYPALTIEQNSHIFAVHYSSGGFEPTNVADGSAALDIGYISGDDQFVSAANVTSGITSGPVAVTHTSTSDIEIGLELTISGTDVSNANSGYIDLMVEYNGEPQYKLEGQSGNPTTIVISSAGTPEIISFNVIEGTTLSLYDQSWTGGSPAGDLLHSIVIKESESFAYTPGPPTLWGR